MAIVTDGDILWHCIEKMIKYANFDVLVMAYNTKFAFGLDVMTGEHKHHRVVKKLKPKDSDCKRVRKEIISQL